MTDSKQLLESLGKKKNYVPDNMDILLPDGSKQKIARWHSPYSLVRDIYSQNQIQHFTSIMMIGGMGSGKSTLATFLAHQLHKKGGYNVRWLDKEDILRADEIFKNLPRSPQILIFNDVSQALTGISQERKTKIVQSLTTVRHDGKEENVRKVIVIINVHYMYSFEKIWRSLGDIKIFTDIQREEVNNIKQFTGGMYNNKLDKFLDICYDQFTRGKFSLSLSKRDEKEYITNEPFRISAVLYRKGMRFMLTWKDSCQLCVYKDNSYNRTKLTAKALVEGVSKKYKRSGVAVLRQLCMQKGISSSASRTHYYAFQDVMKVLSENSVDWEELGLEIRKHAQIQEKHVKAYRKRSIPNDPSSPPQDQVDLINDITALDRKYKANKKPNGDNDKLNVT